MNTPALCDLLDTSRAAPNAAQQLIDAAAVIPAVVATLGEHQPRN